MPCDNNDEHNAGPLICMRDNVLVSTENPQCPHPSSACPFRELCPVKEAMRRKKDLRTAQKAIANYRDSGGFQ